MPATLYIENVFTIFTPWKIPPYTHGFVKRVSRIILPKRLELSEFQALSSLCMFAFAYVYWVEKPCAMDCPFIRKILNLLLKNQWNLFSSPCLFWKIIPVSNIHRKKVTIFLEIAAYIHQLCNINKFIRFVRFIEIEIDQNNIIFDNSCYWNSRILW